MYAVVKVFLIRIVEINFFISVVRVSVRVSVVIRHKFRLRTTHKFYMFWKSCDSDL